MSIPKKIIVESLRKIISEGLIRSYEPEKVISIITRLGIDSDDIYFVDGKITIDAKIKYKDIISDVITRMENALGWYMSGGKEDFHEEMDSNVENIKSDIQYNMGEMENDGYDEDDVALYLYFERKFDEKINPDTLPDVIYHVASKNSLGKIKEIGLKPSHRDKLTHHPDRIYFSTSQSGIGDLMDNDMFEIEEPVVLEIDATKLKGHEFYLDPNFPDSGIYTLQNIHPGAIKSYKEF